MIWWQPLTPEAILGLHRTLTLDTLDEPNAAGRLRRPDEAIDVVDNASYQVLHTPPPAGELPERLERLCRFANPTDADPFIPPILRAILLHFALAYDHPFVDGNGRVARALFYWSALSQGLLAHGVCLHLQRAAQGPGPVRPGLSLH